MKIDGDTVEKISKDVMTVFGRHSKAVGVHVDFIWNAPGVGNPLGAQFKMRVPPYPMLDKMCINAILITVAYNWTVALVDVAWMKDAWTTVSVLVASSLTILAILSRYLLRKHQMRRSIQHTILMMSALDELNLMYRGEIVFQRVNGGFAVLFNDSGE